MYFCQIKENSGENQQCGDYSTHFAITLFLLVSSRRSHHTKILNAIVKYTAKPFRHEILICVGKTKIHGCVLSHTTMGTLELDFIQVQLLMVIAKNNS
jgi:hypothetical protein